MLFFGSWMQFFGIKYNLQFIQSYALWWYGKFPIQNKKNQTIVCITAMLQSSESAASGHISVPNIHQPHPWVRGVKVF